MWTSVNRISVKTAQEAEAVIESFRHRSGKVDHQLGFLQFEVWREEESREVLILTRWARREDFRAWVEGPAFRQAHQRAAGSRGESKGSLYEVVL